MTKNYLIQFSLNTFYLYTYSLLNLNIRYFIFKINLINSKFSNYIILKKNFLYNCYFLPHKIYLNCKKKMYYSTLLTLFNNLLNDLLIIHKKFLIIKGLFFKISKLKNSYLQFELGYSHTIILKIPNNIKIYLLNKKQTKFVLLSNNKQMLFNFIKFIKNIKKINAYKKQGIYLKKEHIILKTGKKKFQ